MVGRAKHSVRHVRVGDMLAAHRGFAEGFDEYAALADKAAQNHNEGKDKSVVASAENGIFDIVDPQKYQLFKQKTRLNPNARTREEIAGDIAGQTAVRQDSTETAPEGAQKPFTLADYLSGAGLSQYDLRVFQGSCEPNITHFSTDYVTRAKDEDNIAYGWAVLH